MGVKRGTIPPVSGQATQKLLKGKLSPKKSDLYYSTRMPKLSNYFTSPEIWQAEFLVHGLGSHPVIR